MKKKIWGQLMSIDLYECQYSLLINPKKLGEFCAKLCQEIKMVPFGKPIIKKLGKGELRGYSLMQFIETSTITIHLDEFGLRVFIDIFSCKTFDINKVKKLSQSFFGTKKIRYKNFYRGQFCC